MLVECDRCSDMLPSIFMNVTVLGVVCDICLAKHDVWVSQHILSPRVQKEQWTRSRDPHYESFLKGTFENEE